MAEPITGPFYRDSLYYDINGRLTSEQYRMWHRQRKPYNLPLAFSLYLRKVVTFSQSGDWVTGTSVHQAPIPGSATSSTDRAYNAAYSRFVGKARDTASWSVSLAERKQAVSMISNRATQLFSFARALRRGQVTEAAAVLNIRGTPADQLSKRQKVLNWRRDGRDFGGAFLEYHLGWAPVISDIGKSIEILQRPFNMEKIKAQGRDQTIIRNDWNDGYTDYNEDNAVNSGVVIGGRVRLSNSDALLANQMGFVNPLGVAWEVVPWSFLVDWVVNVGDVINSLTDLVGLELEDVYITRFQLHKRQIYAKYYTGPSWTGRYESCSVGRGSVGVLPGPKLIFNPPERLSLSRAATAISLLLQRLKG